MAYTNTGILNLALIRIKVPTVTNIIGAEKAAKLATTVWDYIRDEVLEAHDWNFAKLTAELAQVTAYHTAPTDPKWEYKYTTPASCLKIRKVVDESDTPVPYVEEGDYIYCNYDSTSYSLYIRYTTIITDPTKYKPSFINALAWRLGAELSNTLVSGEFEHCMNMYAIALRDAEGKNQAQDYVEGEEGNTNWIDR